MVTALYASILGLLLVFLSLKVIHARMDVKSALGDAGDIKLKRRIRAQGNLAEYAPIFLIMLALSELNGLPLAAVHILGAAFCLGRFSHAYSLLLNEKYDDEGKLISEKIVFRLRGMQITLFSIIGLGLILIAQFVLNLIA